MKKIILASSSPRRIEMLQKYKLDPLVVKLPIEEKLSPTERPEQIAMSLAFEKAFLVAARGNYTRDQIIIGADTIVVEGQRILGKPRDEEDAFNILKALNGKEHQVITGFCIMRGDFSLKFVDYEITRVGFRHLSDDKILRYVDTGEPMDKAGAYAIQGYGQVLVQEIHGSYTNIIGLPIESLDRILEEYFDISIL
ncbi:MAG: Maf family protein [Tissierellaceae bacterium]